MPRDCYPTWHVSTLTLPSALVFVASVCEKEEPSVPLGNLSLTQKGGFIMYNRNSHGNGVLKAQFKKLVEKGSRGREILAELGLTPLQARRLHYELLNAGEIGLGGNLEFANLGEPEVAQKGNVFITAQWLEALGLGGIFRPGARLKYVVTGDALTIEVVPEQGATSACTGSNGNGDTEPPSGWRRIFGKRSRQQRS